MVGRAFEFRCEELEGVTVGMAIASFFLPLRLSLPLHPHFRPCSVWSESSGEEEREKRFAKSISFSFLYCLPLLDPKISRPLPGHSVGSKQPHTARVKVFRGYANIETIKFIYVGLRLSNSHFRSPIVVSCFRMPRNNCMDRDGINHIPATETVTYTVHYSRNTSYNHCTLSIRKF